MADRTYTIGSAVFQAPALAPGLYPVATPIGNLRDVTIRALETLAAADIVACEDTRVTRVLLNRYGITRKTFPYHEHNADEAGARLIEALRNRQSVAFCSDAGTPLVSDPGQRLVSAARVAGLPVFAVPGASAPLAALSASGLPTDAFFFAGFLPHKAGPRAARLRELAAVPATLVFFESPNRTAAALAQMAEIFGPDRLGAVARELTKAFEEVVAAPLAELAARHAEADPRGEIVLLVAPPAAAAADAWAGRDVDALLADLATHMPASKAAAEAARQTGLAKGDLFRRLNALKEGA
ncbi:MAG: 16S rRNA (cytidine(1402)-2'-O)-methyltransferase [Rhizobiaceae bacterium]|nr:16S rRNA (cytidine(1402)-2'-O)-methyltransferase [Rhizobiaceae bacterium]